MGKNDGGPAYPTTAEQWNDGFGGMSIRDEFAKEAMKVVGLYGDDLALAAKTAYAFADAMLAERNEE